MARTDPEGFKTPGQLVRSTLEERGWSQRVLALVLGVHESTINKLLSDRKPMTAEMALQLQEVLDLEADRLLSLQKSYELAKARIKARPDPSRELRARLLGSLPVSEMIQRGWIHAESIKDLATVEAELARFFGVDSAEEIEFSVAHAARRSNEATDLSPLQLAWFMRVRQIAGDMLARAYSKAGLNRAIGELSALRSSPDLARKVPRLLTDAGVRFLLVEALPGSKIDGVCFWLDDKSPVVALSLRFDRIDNFWFVLRHELEHVLRGHGKDKVVVDTDIAAGMDPEAEVAEEEKVANEAAADFCVSRVQLQRFVSHKAPYYSERDLVAFSRMVKVHPGLVAGQLQHLTGRYDRFRKHLVSVRSHVIPNAISDGWGDVYPLDI